MVEVPISEDGKGLNSLVACRPTDADLAEIFTKGVRQVRVLEREVGGCPEKAKFTTGVVTNAVDFACVDRPAGQQLSKCVGQLDFTLRVWRCRVENGENVWSEDVAANNGKVGRLSLIHI